MGLGQTMFTLGFLFLLALAIINANKMMLDKNENYYKQEALKQASELANSLFSEISKKAFNADVDTAASAYLDTSSFDYTNNLGPDADRFVNGWATELRVNIDGKPDTTYPFFRSIRRFDDIDDYNGYLREVNTSTLKGFKLYVNVYYVDTTATRSFGRTYLKKIDIKVWNPNYLFTFRTKDNIKLDTLTFSTIITF